MPQEILDQLARLGELTGAELTKLQDSIVKEFDKVDKKKDKSAADVEILDALVLANDQVAGEQTARADAAAASEERAKELRAKMHPEGGEPAATDPAEGDGEGEGGEGEGDGEGDGVTDPATQGIAAGATPPAAPAPAAPALPSLSTLNSRRPGRPAETGPVATRAKARTVAGYNGRGLQINAPVPTVEAFNALMADKVQQLLRGKPTGEKFLVASILTDYPTERFLDMDLDRNEGKVQAVASVPALLASGGVCGPVGVDYDIMVLSSDEQPLGDSLPKFGGDRGGVRYITPPTFAGVGASATAVWTEATDASPGGQTKPVQTISCGAVLEAYVDAIPTRLKFGNMQERFFPELVAANTRLAMANAARVIELNRLAKISASSTLVSSGQLLGASRDLLATLDQALAAMRYRSRLDRTVPIRAVYPDWAKDMFRADFARELAHAQDGDFVSLSVSDEQIEQLFKNRGVNVTWLLDGQALVTAAPSQVFQGFGAQNANTTLLGWPTEMSWWLFPEGSFQLIDGGQMDFGVIRDSTLDATNDYETMIEIFEQVIFRGFESLQIASAVRPNGASAAGITTANSSVY